MLTQTENRIYPKISIFCNRHIFFKLLYNKLILLKNNNKFQHFANNSSLCMKIMLNSVAILYHLCLSIKDK